MTVSNSESENHLNGKIYSKIDRGNTDIGSSLQDFCLNFFRRSEGKSF